MAASGNLLQKSQSRRVSINASKSKGGGAGFYGMSDSESLTPDRRRRTLGKCNSCCGCIGMLIGMILLFGLLMVVIFFAFLQSCLPDAHFRRLDIRNMQLDQVGKQTYLSVDMDATLNTTNGNSKIELSYASMVAVLSTSGVTFNSVKLSDIRQRPSGMTSVVVRASARKMAVEEPDAKELNESYKKHALLLNLAVKGTIGFSLSGKKVATLPFKIDCHSIDQEEIDSGKAPGCHSQMSFI